MKSKPWKTTAAWVFLSMVLCGSLGIWVGFRAGLIERVYVYRDEGASHQLSSNSPIRSVSWTRPVEIPMNPALREAAVPFPHAGSRPGGSPPVPTSAKNADGNFDIQLLVYSPDGWATPTSLAGAVNSPHDEITPLLAPGGEVLFFASNRPGGLGGFDLYLSRRGADGWEAPSSLGSRVNSPYDDTGPALHPSGTLLVLATNRPRSFLLSPPGEWSDVPLPGWKAADDELAYSILEGDPSRLVCSGVRPLETLSSPAGEREPCFSPAGDFLYFSSARRGGLGGFDLYRSRCHLSAEEDANTPVIEAPENLGRPLNTIHDDGAPKLFHAGFAMLYRISRAGEETDSLLESRTREVSSELEFASIPLRLLGRNLARIGLLFLAGAILILFTLALLRYRRFWTLNLILRCVAIALLVHAAMLYGFYFWQVSDDIVALAEKANVAEITVEKTLAAKLSLEARRLDIQVPEKAQPALRPVTLEERIASPTVTSNEEPLATEVLAIRESAVSVEHETAFEMSLRSRATQPAQDLETPRMDSTPRHSSIDLPVPHRPVPEEASTGETEEVPDLMPEAGVAASWKVDMTTPRPGPVSAFEEKAGSPDSLPIEPLVREASTQVHAPIPEEALLPPIARPVKEPPPAMTVLPVPAQSRVPMPESRRTADLAPPRVSPGRNFDRLAENAAPAVRTTALVKDRVPWKSQVRGILPTAQEVVDTLELPETHLHPVERPRSIAGATAKLPEAVPLAETASPGETATVAPSMRPSEKVAAASAAEEETESELRWAVARVQSAPLIARTASIIPVRAASPDHLASRPQPGARLPTVRAQSQARAVPNGVTLPEGEAGSKPATGAPQVADTLTPKQPSRALRHSAPGARRRGFAGNMRERLPPLVVRPDSSTKKVKPSALRHPQPPVEAALTRMPQPTTRSPRPASPPTVALKLPEATPDLEYEANLKTVRSPAMRKLLVERMGGSDASEDAVRRALDWLARHQSPAGYWDVDGFDARCQGCRGGSSRVTCKNCDVAVTALALLCFLGQNHTPENPWSPFREHVSKAIAWLLSVAAPDGSLAGGDLRYTMYSHGIATLALSEAYILTGQDELLEPLDRAVQLILSSQNRDTGGWRYKPRPPLRGDTSITGWQVLALTSARGAGLDVPEETLERARHWLDHEAASGQHGGIYGYTSADEPRLAMVAEGMYARLLLGAKRGDRNIEEAARYIHSATRAGGHLDNLYLLYYGNLSLYYYQGWIWERWNEEVRNFLVRSQQRAGRLAGSWDPTGPWSESAGRVLSTCLATLTLEVYYRYLPLYWMLDANKAAQK